MVKHFHITVVLVHSYCTSVLILSFLEKLSEDNLDIRDICFIDVVSHQMAQPLDDLVDNCPRCQLNKNTVEQCLCRSLSIRTIFDLVYIYFCFSLFKFDFSKNCHRKCWFLLHKVSWIYPIRLSWCLLLIIRFYMFKSTSKSFWCRTVFPKM